MVFHMKNNEPLCVICNQTISVKLGLRKHIMEGHIILLSRRFPCEYFSWAVSAREAGPPCCVLQINFFLLLFQKSTDDMSEPEDLKIKFAYLRNMVYKNMKRNKMSFTLLMWTMIWPFKWIMISRSKFIINKLTRNI